MRKAAVIKKRKKRFFLFLTFCVSLFFLFFCTTDKNIIIDEPAQNDTEHIEINENNVFLNDLLAVLKGDPYLRMLIDKKNSFDSYVPHDLVALRSSNYRSFPGFMLRAEAAASLEEMAAAAAKDGLRLTVSSAYRSYSCQAEIYSNYVSRFGIAYADRISARPGHSQHQLGLAVDFGQVSNSFAQTAEGFWLAANASRFGWSLSYPKGFEKITGYSWESWHYRYVGKELAKFINKYFDGIQQDALVFIHEWERDRAF